MSREKKSHHTSPGPAACKWLLDAMPLDSLYEAIRGLGREAGELLPGFSLSHRALGRQSVRALLARALGKHPRLAGRVFMAHNTPWEHWVKALEMLEEDYLLACWRDLVRSCGICVAVAMALDTRESMQKRGLRMLAMDSRWWKGQTPTVSLQPDWTNLIELLTAHQAVEQAKDEPLPDTSGRMHELEQKCGQLRETIERWKRKGSEAEAQVASEREEQREALRQLRHQLRDREAETDHLRDQFEQRLSHQVAALRDQLLCAPPELPATTDPAGRTLAERAAEALARQNALDERHGTRPQLQVELEELEKQEKRLRHCFEASLILVPGLRETAAQVGQRLREIRETLGDIDTDTEVPDLAAALFCRLKNAHLATDPTAELASLRDTLGLEVVRDVLGPRVHSRLLKVERTRSQLVAERVLDETAPATMPAPEEREVWNVAERLACYPTGTVWLFIDGYNAIRRVHALNQLEQEQGMAAARDHLCALCRRHAHQLCHLEIVFDGIDTVAGAESCAAVQVVYAGSTGESQSADDYLERRLRIARGDAATMWLVTDDFGLRNRVAATCDAFVPPVLLHRFLTA